jgi:tRNA threonylcarbamoyl adenosine modification protein YeaZ
MPSPPLGLAIHTSSPDLGLALGQWSEAPIVQVWDLGRDLSAMMHLKLAEFMAEVPWKSLDFIAVAQGPGSFTGTRMGVVTARTLAQQLDIPLFGISSLAAIAASQADEWVAMQLPAQRGEFHVGVYRRGDRLPSVPTSSEIAPETATDRVMTPDQWTAYQAQFPSAQPSAPKLIEVPIHQGIWVEQVLQLAQGAFKSGDRPHWATIVPTYGQNPIQ